jgi:hypothetical protein
MLACLPLSLRTDWLKSTAAAAMMVAYRIADAQGWVLGETLERPVKALENEIAAA